MPQKLRSRKFLLALAGNIVGILVLLYPSESEVIIQVAQKAVSALLIVGSSYGFIRSEGERDRQQVIQDGELKLQEMIHERERERERAGEIRFEGGAGADAQRPANQGAEAKSLMGAMLLMPLLLLGGCDTSPGGYRMDTPKGTYDAAQETFIATVKTLNTGRRTGLFNDQEWADIVDQIQRGDRILDKMEQAALAEDSDIPRTVLTTFRAIMRELSVWASQVAQEQQDERESSDDRDVDTGSSFGARTRHLGVQAVRRDATREVPGGAPAASEDAGRASDQRSSRAAAQRGRGQCSGRERGWRLERRTAERGAEPRRLAA